jgi:hypothetical protein
MLVKITFFVPLHPRNLKKTNAAPAGTSCCGRCFKRLGGIPLRFVDPKKVSWDRAVGEIWVVKIKDLEDDRLKSVFDINQPSIGVPNFDPYPFFNDAYSFHNSRK